jgi:hypothetical protein
LKSNFGELKDGMAARDQQISCGSLLALLGVILCNSPVRVVRFVRTLVMSFPAARGFFFFSFLKWRESHNCSFNEANNHSS